MFECLRCMTAVELGCDYCEACAKAVKAAAAKMKCVEGHPVNQAEMDSGHCGHCGLPLNNAPPLFPDAAEHKVATC